MKELCSLSTKVPEVNFFASTPAKLLISSMYLRDESLWDRQNLCFQQKFIKTVVGALDDRFKVKMIFLLFFSLSNIKEWSSWLKQTQCNQNCATA